MIKLTGVNGKREVVGTIYIFADSVESVYVLSNGMTLVQPRSGGRPHSVAESVDEVVALVRGDIPFEHRTPEEQLEVDLDDIRGEE